MERRKFKRFITDPQRVQALATANRERYSIRDISRGGLMLEYGPAFDISHETDSINITAMNDHRLVLSKIACETVYDIPTLAQNESFSGNLRRLRGLKFTALTPDQLNDLNTLIDHWGAPQT